MRRGKLSDYFEGVIVKRLSVVETTRAISNQHEFNGTTELRRLLGEADRRNIPARFLWLGQEQEAITIEGMLSWYDARRKHPSRTEYRLYYYSNEVTDMMRVGDVFFLAMCRDGSAMIIVTEAESTMQNQLLWLFGLEAQPEFQFTYQEIRGENDTGLDFAARYILDELGVEPEEPEADRLDTIIEPFGLTFPTTRIFSECARASLLDVVPLDDPDRALVAWMEREEQLFRRLERRIVTERIGSGFKSTTGVDVDGFLSFSLSMQNRRKARAGFALENHVEAILLAHGIRYERGVETENRNKPDFLFPGKTQYLDIDYPDDRLTMLGTKSSLKDRWRQVLSEAERIETKHLLTLEPGISENQTAEMQAKYLQLVLPKDLHQTFRPMQQPCLMDVAALLDLLIKRQRTSP